MRRMTDEQRKLVEENTALALWFSNKNEPPLGYTRSEWDAECLYSLCRAAIYYDKAKGTAFTTYAILSMRSGYAAAMSHRLSRIRDARRSKAMPSDFDWIDPSAEPGCRNLERLEAEAQARKLVECLTDGQRAVVLQRLQGRMFRDIAKEQKQSKQASEFMHKRAVKRMAREAARLQLEPAI